MEGIIISGFTEIGKTTVARKYPDKVIELESANYKYNTSRTGRSALNKTLNSEWPNNYVEAIMEAGQTYKIVLVSQESEIRKILDEKGVEYLIGIPSQKCKKEYINRSIKRGSNPVFVDIIDDYFEKWIQNLMKCPQEKLIINPGKHLEDVMKEKGLI